MTHVGDLYFTLFLLVNLLSFNAILTQRRGRIELLTFQYSTS